MKTFLTLALLLLLCLSLPAGAATPEELRHQITDSGFTAAWPARIASDMEQFYSLRGFMPVWNSGDSVALKKTLAFLDSLREMSDYHGLETASYHIDEMRALANDRDADKVLLELMMTAAMVRLAHDLHGDTLNLDELYTGWTFARDAFDVPGRLKAAIDANDLNSFYTQAAPRSDAYAFLADTLETYRALAAQGEWTAVAGGPKLLPGERGPRVAQMRARLFAERYMTAMENSGDTEYFDDGLRRALIAYQVRNGLTPDGQAGAKTIEALNVSLATRIEQIRANMERWRHMSDDYPPARFIEVNIPDFSVTVTEDRQIIYRGIVVVGRVDRQTPFINSKVVNTVINPPWNVPAKLARLDILPKLKRDPAYLEKNGMVIVGREDDPSGTQIDWRRMGGSFPYTLRQRPGDFNSLGQVKLNFVNAFDVYMHGTPHQELFDKAERAFSSGCVRLQEPERVAELLLAGNRGKTPWTADRIAEQIAEGGSRTVMLDNPMPVIFAYWSVYRGPDGQAFFRKDIYGYDIKLMRKLKTQEARYHSRGRVFRTASK